jgi:hypothetical protein
MTKRHPSIRHSPLGLALLAAGLLSACGSSNSSGNSTATAAGTATTGTRAALTACLKKHGITIPQGRRGPAGGPPGGVPGAPGAGGPPAGFPGNAKFQAAFKACGANLPAGPRGGAFSRQRVQSYVSCVRRHGYKLPQPNFSGKGSVFPNGIRSSASFQKASRACQSLLAPPGQPAAPPGA